MWRMADYDLTRRPRRLRQTPAIREFVTETRLHPADFILPLFIADGIDAPREIPSMPGVYQHTPESLVEICREALDAGVKCVDLFGVPRDEDKDATGSVAVADDGVLNRAIALLRKEFGDELIIMADTCLDEFTDHGHCGVLTEDGRVDNDATLEIYAQMGLAQVQAGADVLGPSGMMDGQVRVIREALEAAGHTDTVILAYAAKYASAFYGPFRDAVDSQLQGDRRTYQMDAANRTDAVREVMLDLEEGADMVMVKPAMSYLDVVADVAELADVPVAAYQISGEYSMIEAAAANGWIDREAAIAESVLAIHRAGADSILTYWAAELGRRLMEENA